MTICSALLTTLEVEGSTTGWQAGGPGPRRFRWVTLCILQMTLKLTFWCTHQVIPWLLSDSNFVRCTSQRLDPSKTVFVGALHGGSPMHAIKWPFCSLLTRCAHCWRFGPSVCRLVWRCCLRWHWHWQIQVSKRFSDFSARHLPVKMNYRNQKQNVLNQNVQVPHWKWPCYLQQCQVLHEGCGRCFHWDQDCQVHQEGFTVLNLHFESAMDCQQINNRTVLEQKLSRLLCSAKLLSGASWPLLGRRSLLLLPLAPRTLLLQVQWTLFTYLPWMLQALYTIANIQRHGLLQLLLPCLLGVATWCWPSPPSAYHEEHKGWRQHGQVKSCLHLFEYQS